MRTSSSASVGDDDLPGVTTNPPSRVHRLGCAREAIWLRFVVAMHSLFSVCVGALITVFVVSHCEESAPSRLPTASSFALIKAQPSVPASDPDPELTATLVQTHTNERLPLHAISPSPERLAKLLADHVTSE